MVAVELFTVDNKFSIQGNSLELLAAIPTILVAIKKNYLLLTVIVGVISIAILRIGLFYL
ncbi:AzlD domain-containing protein [Clostridium sp.]|uniref:AzlD domain-containing protein n=1 Tax=Clostridium sp. TaxID=1506 RepID=UPI0028427359|nr:AzlD domain-containing protein [Clostridium sp.]MDR3596421.1 AzlD domain-containing protein [Clostridium sp.]